MRQFHHAACDGRVQARQADIQTGLKEESVFGLAQIDFGIHRNVVRQGHVQRDGCLAHRPDETSRPTRRQQLLRIGAGT
ncbi:hypothetical protein D3C86_1619140 [compost metagenome]